MRRVALSLLLACMLPGNTRAADIALDVAHSTSVSLVRFDGEIRRGESYKAQEVVDEVLAKRRGKPVVFLLNSPGGDHFEGMLVGLLLKRKGIGTAILPVATCASACSSIFWGGFNTKTGKPDRVVYEGGRLGVHRWRRVDGGEHTEQVRDRVNGGAGWYFDQVSVSPPVRAKFFEPPATSMYFLSTEDMTGSGIAVRSAASAPKVEAPQASTQLPSLPPPSAPGRFPARWLAPRP